MADRPGAATRRLVAERARFHCEYCVSPAGLAPSPFSAEHVIPRSKGGGHSAQNLAFSCQGCNGHKASKIAHLDPATRIMTGLFNPRVQRWSDCFSWSADGLRIEGLNAV